ncbi:winged helix-turn-helix transcriptional regulator [Clostridium tyrobutyricum]|uniref:winged helix-turn-helix transcriptional regulator n=1 Tax=Clostridium tyrobutyricum TaxID=1519 RepID=UPI001C38B23F|nr:helix-turn-helix domain-containing protein [Clostridium tyrobutyricum]MBV4414984.1 helix-turn-helix transcriptional regulator [Clostridium tyrobutyricum]
MQKTYTNKEVPKLAKEKCAVIYSLEIIGGKWRLPVIWKLSKQESMRYNELKRHLEGITNIMLTRTLQDLEKHGLVIRNEYLKIPPHVEYSLTESARILIPALEIIGAWGRNKMSEETTK